VDAALDARKEDAGGGETEADYGAAEGDGDEVTLLMRSVMVNFIVQNDGYSPSQERDEGQPLCMRGSLETQDKDEQSEKARCEKCLSIATEITGPLEQGTQMCGMCKGTAFEVAEDEDSGSDSEESARDQGGSTTESDTAEFNSYEHLPQLLQMLVSKMEKDLQVNLLCEQEDSLDLNQELVDDTFDVKGLGGKRNRIRDRTERYAQKTLMVSGNAERVWTMWGATRRSLGLTGDTLSGRF
jgi:hypothetical protein